MKLLSIILCMALLSCNTMKLDATGDKKLSANTKHFQRIYAKEGGFWAGKKYITFPKPKK